MIPRKHGFENGSQFSSFIFCCMSSFTAFANLDKSSMCKLMKDSVTAIKSRVGSFISFSRIYRNSTKSIVRIPSIGGGAQWHGHLGRVFHGLEARATRKIKEHRRNHAQRRSARTFEERESKRCSLSQK